MITIQSRVNLDGISGAELFEFFMNPTDHGYQTWWPGTHLQFHVLRRRPNHVGDVVYMDEWVGKYRIRMSAVVIEAEPGKKIVWQMRQGFRIPAWLILELADHINGVTLTHTLCMGFTGLGRIVDPLLRLYASEEFEKAMDGHARTEFPMLRDLLLQQKTAGTLSPGS
jgi:hypothetical protein